MAVGYIKRLAGPYTGAGTTALPFGFKIFEATDVFVALAEKEGDVSHNLTIGIDYTVSMNTDQEATPGGTVTLVNPLAEGQVVSVGTDIPYTQTTELTNYSRFPPNIINTALDRIVVQIQQIIEQLERALITDPTDSVTPRELRDKLLAAVDEALKAAESASTDAATTKNLAESVLAIKSQIQTVVDNLDDVKITAENAKVLTELADNLTEILKAKDYSDEAKSWAEKANAITGGQAVIATGTTEPRKIVDRFADVVNAEDFGATGDGSTYDTDAFNALESAHAGKRVNLHGKTFKVETPPSKNYYYNGFWNHDKNFAGKAYTAIVPAYCDNVRMQYGSTHSGGAGTSGRNYCVLNDAPEEDVAKTNLKDVVAIGEGTLKKALGKHGMVSGCVAIGRGALANGAASGCQNIGIGNFALHNIETGDRDIAIGSLSMLFATTCRQTVSIGRDSSQCAVGGSQNTVVGYGAIGGEAPVGLSTWLERQNEVYPTRLTVVGTRALNKVSGVNTDAVVVGAYAAYQAKTINYCTIVGSRAAQSAGRDVSVDGYDLSTPTELAGTYTTDGTSKIKIVLSESPSFTAGTVVAIEFSDSDSDTSLSAYGDSLYVDSVSGSTVIGRFVEITEEGNEFPVKNIPAGSGACTVGSGVPFSYSANGTEYLTITLPDGVSNSAVVGRRIMVATNVTTDSPIKTEETGWLRVYSVSGQTIVAVDDNLDTEGGTSRTISSGTGTGRILSFELSSKENAAALHGVALSTVSGMGAARTSDIVYQSCLYGHRVAESANVYRATVIGYRAGRTASSISQSTLIGYTTRGDTGQTVQDSVLIVNEPGASPNVAATVAVGNSVNCGPKGNLSVLIGNDVGSATTSADRNTYVGARAGSYFTVDNCYRNAALGYCALYGQPKDESGNAIAINNSVGIGAYSAVTGSHQVQLGGSNDTVYSYSAVQTRSDERDKADIRDTELGSEFILSLRPVDFKWDIRSDYVEPVEHEETYVDEDGKEATRTVVSEVVHEKDGSRKRTRFHHGFIAQEVKETMDKLGVDFGGYQDHSVNGGCDVLSLGYEELIAPLVKTVQELNARIAQLEAKLSS